MSKRLARATAAAVTATALLMTLSGTGSAEAVGAPEGNAAGGAPASAPVAGANWFGFNARARGTTP